MTKQKVYILIPGIWSNPGDNFAWLDQAEDYIERNFPNSRARQYEYFSPAIFRRIGQQKRAREVASISAKYLDDGYDVALVGHSNGSDIICRALSLLNPCAGISEVHLIAGACEEDFRRNGLNVALASERVRRVFVYSSHSDTALSKYASKSRWFRFLGLGYGLLGLVGPKHALSEFGERITNYREDHLGHCDWLGGEDFVQTMRRVTQSDCTK